MSRDNERIMKGMEREIEVDNKLDLIGSIGASLFAVVFTFGMFFLRNQPRLFQCELQNIQSSFLQTR